MRCSGLTVRGEPCRAQALVESDRCYAHRRVVDEAAVEKLVAWLRAGNYVDVAARAAGVPLAELPYETLEQLDVARAEGEARGIATIARAATESWQAAAWLLERQYPERWGRPAIRAEELPPLTSDGLDELAGKREARRAEIRR